MFSSIFPTLSKHLNRKIIFVFLIFHLIAVFFSLGYHQFDEHYQILEFAGWKLGLPASLPWEFYSQIRPSLQPTIVYVFYQIGEWIVGSGNVNPFHLTTFLRFFTFLLYTLALLCFLEAMIKNTLAKLNSARLITFILWLSVIIWFFPYQAVRFSSENFSRIFILFSLALPFLEWNRWNPKVIPWVWLVAGSASGIAFSARYQSAFLTIGLFFWLIFIKKEEVKNLSLFALGVVLAISANLLLDVWFYGEWALAPWNYFKINILEERVNSFGTSPWYDYFIQATNLNLPFFPLFTLIPVLFFGLFPLHPLTWMSVPFLVAHFIIGHKELRFLFPLVTFLPIFIAMVFDKWKIWTDPSRYPRLKRGLVLYFFIVNSFFLFYASIWPLDFRIPSFYKYLYDHHPQKPVFYLDHENYDFIRNPFKTFFILQWYLVDINITSINSNNWALEIQEYSEKNDHSLTNKTIVLASPTLLILDDKKLNPTWSAKESFPLPRWEYSFPFKNIEEYPLFYDLWAKKAILPVFHIYLWETTTHNHQEEISEFE